MTFEIEAEIQNRLFQDPLGAKDEGDQQPPESSVSVKERVNGFKLDMNQSRLDERWNLNFVVMDEGFEVR